MALNQMDEVLAKLERLAFAELESEFTALHMQFERGDISDLVYAQLLPFDLPARHDLTPLYKAWCVAYPQSFIAHSFAGFAELLLAWQARSSAMGAQVSDARCKAMLQHFERGETLLLSACELTAKPHWVIRLGMTLQLAGHRTKAEPNWRSRMENLLPSSAYLCGQWMWTLNPKWGGSESALTEFRNLARTWFDDAQFSHIESRYYAERADIQRCAGRFEQAVKYFELSLASSSDSVVDADSHAYCLAELGRDRQALAVLNDSMQKSPNNMSTLKQLGWQTEELIVKGLVADTPAAWERAFALRARAARYGDGDAAGHCVRLLRKQGISPQNWQSAQDYAKLSMQQYSAIGYFQIGCILYEGEGMPRQVARAVQYWQQASELGHDTASENVVAVLWNGTDGMAKDYRAAFQAAERGEQIGSVFCTGALGRMYLRGHGTKVDLATGADLIQEAAEAGDEEAIAEWVRCLHFGRGAVLDREQAEFWLATLFKSNPTAADALRAELGSLWNKCKSLVRHLSFTKAKER